MEFLDTSNLDDDGSSIRASAFNIRSDMSLNGRRPSRMARKDHNNSMSIAVNAD
jgi:hypothetical protein